MGAMFGLCLGGPVGLLAGVRFFFFLPAYCRFPPPAIMFMLTGEAGWCCGSRRFHPWIRRRERCEGAAGPAHLHRRALCPRTRPLCSQSEGGG